MELISKCRILHSGSSVFLFALLQFQDVTLPPERPFTAPRSNLRSKQMIFFPLFLFRRFLPVLCIKKPLEKLRYSLPSYKQIINIHGIF